MDVVTGAFSFTGRFIARRLLAEGREARTLTGHPERADSRETRLSEWLEQHADEVGRSYASELRRHYRR